MENKNLDGSKVTASGWGVTKHGANDSGETLRKVVMDVIPNPTCNKQYPSQKIKDSMMCTLTRNKDTCQGDSELPATWGGSKVKLEPTTAKIAIHNEIIFNCWDTHISVPNCFEMRKSTYHKQKWFDNWVRNSA
ncbi:unnamed protein product [Allacma fusca]|uniref:Peptidase S1 domain-containing protein n=1 Tax=Allacma fusca TaxID=39272 RepID=A0A8J2L6U0_9HEXA|nr:unnamed protein product [Allacma fusca]